ncbi:hypothetical protein [Acidovorax sp. SRB_14]|uniref:hypothetical protein n=1 Tax=Acidovorax sp. SRB_14 TaxID=1962699 RepID=UPI001566DA68|nr:hypothetical protein [Acidovorax sp. SRB_14]
MFNLLVASWLVVSMLPAGLTAVGMPMLLMLPLWLYSVWVSGKALSGAIPKANLAYNIGGTVACLIRSVIVIVLVMGHGTSYRASSLRLGSV